jgi:hypothetical protein
MPVEFDNWMHEEILAAGNEAAALAVGVQVAREIGLNEKQIALLYGEQTLDEWREEDHPRHPGGRPTGGRFRKKGAGVSSFTPEHGTMVAGTDIGEDMSRKDPLNRDQPVESFEELRERSKKVEQKFNLTVAGFANKVEGKPLLPGLKGIPRSVEKIRDEYKGDFTKLKDTLRATILHDTVLESRRAAALFMAEHGDKVYRVKDRFLNPTPEEYRDIMINFDAGDGMIAELQFNTKKLYAAKSSVGHDYYERQRKIWPDYERALAEGNADFEQAAFTYELLQTKQIKLYGFHYRESGNGIGWCDVPECK